MLSQALLQSAFENTPELTNRPSGTVGTGAAVESGGFSEMLNEKVIPTDNSISSAADTSGIMESASATPEQAPANNTTIPKSSELSDYLGGFNALSGLLVRFWKKKELIDNEKNADAEDEEAKNDALKYPVNERSSADDELSALSARRKKEQRPTTERKI